MKITKSGNIAITINPERHYKGQFIGKEYYCLGDVKSAFPFVSDFSKIESAGKNLGCHISNDEMVRHHVQAFRRVGYYCE